MHHIDERVGHGRRRLRRAHAPKSRHCLLVHGRGGARVDSVAEVELALAFDALEDPCLRGAWLDFALLGDELAADFRLVALLVARQGAVGFLAGIFALDGLAELGRVWAEGAAPHARFLVKLLDFRFGEASLCGITGDAVLNEGEDKRGGDEQNHCVHQEDAKPLAQPQLPFRAGFRHHQVDVIGLDFARQLRAREPQRGRRDEGHHHAQRIGDGNLDEALRRAVARYRDGQQEDCEDDEREKHVEHFRPDGGAYGLENYGRKGFHGLLSVENCEANSLLVVNDGFGKTLSP